MTDKAKQWLNLGLLKNAKKLMKNGRTRDQLEKKVTKTSSKKNGWCAANCGAQPIIPQNPARVTLIQVDRRALTNKIRRTKAGSSKKTLTKSLFQRKNHAPSCLGYHSLTFEFDEICIFPEQHRITIMS